jgi:hypothetical protein
MGQARIKRLAAEKAGTPYPPDKLLRSPYFDILKAVLALAKAGGVRQTTPTTPLSKTVTDLCEKISPGETPVFLDFSETDPRYAASNCHTNVFHLVREHGGERVNGWIIWEGRFAEAEFHAVWRSPEGELYDVTPRADGEKTVLFLPDLVTKVTRGQNGLMLPCNRTSVPECPYVGNQMPQFMPFLEKPVNEAALERARSLGVDPYSVCEDA